ncbi:aminotransferase class III-fold pyridoxal phosphate-dependent enzyme [Planosporangium thailandense]|uniref:aminotransferase class III-fold pyridoxal phosphate-dependent enzyme n=1 Tax=Planosporangium thailandense TaxID=765197 RepID=UPI00197C335C
MYGVIRRHVSPGLALGYKLVGHGAYEVAASGATVRLSDGRTLVDFGSYAVTLLGHRCPPVVDAVATQLATMPTATRAVGNPVVAAFVEELADRCGAGLDRVWLGSDGADAVEVALKLARRGSGRRRILAVEDGFHGKTLGALAATAAPAFRAGLEDVLAPVTHLPRDDAGAVAREVRAGDVAAVIVEPVQGEAGVRPLDASVVARWAADAHAAGAYVISDEIQAGLRRCGSFSVAVDTGWAPDAVLFGKALGGGVLPLSAAVGTADFFAPLVDDPTWHTATFGGHPLSCAAGRASLRVIDELAGRADELGTRFARDLCALAAAHPALVCEVRGRGLLWGVEFATPAMAGSVLVELADAGLLVSPCLSSRRTIRLLPPMVTTEAELRRAFDALAAALVATEEFAEGACDADVGDAA